MARTPAPGYYRFMLGNFEVTALSDGTVDLPVEQLLQEPATKTVAALDNAFLKTPLQLSDNAYLINTGKRLVLVDGCRRSVWPDARKVDEQSEGIGLQTRTGR
jgi:hypothetical protein